MYKRGFLLLRSTSAQRYILRRTATSISLTGNRSTWYMWSDLVHWVREDLFVGLFKFRASFRRTYAWGCFERRKIWFFEILFETNDVPGHHTLQYSITTGQRTGCQLMTEFSCAHRVLGGNCFMVNESFWFIPAEETEITSNHKLFKPKFTQSRIILGDATILGVKTDSYVHLSNHDSSVTQIWQTDWANLDLRAFFAFYVIFQPICIPSCLWQLFLCHEEFFCRWWLTPQ